MTAYPNCKINLGLHVIGRRPDGYHDIETVFLPVHDLRDTLTITPAPAGTDRPTMIQHGIPLDNAPDDNLCLRAWHLLHDEFGIPPVGIELRKEIPFGAGLGGGSSDAAFTLRMLNDMFGLGLDSNQLALRAARLGADCPFFIHNQPAYATGIGDRLEHFNIDLTAYRIELGIPAGEHVSTREAYAGLAAASRQPAPDLRQALRQPIDEWRHSVVNHFEASVFPQHPAIAALKAEMYNRGALYASMTGSGAAVFGIFAR